MMRAVCILLAVLLSAIATRSPVHAAETLSTEPVLRVETGAHGARINRLVVDPTDNRLISVADDKTVRAWSLSDGRLLATLRIPIGAGPEGRLHAVAVSPSGKSIVVGGYTGLTWFASTELYVFDRKTGAWRGSIGFGENGAAPVRDMTFLPDGRLLVALDDRKGLRVVDFTAQSIRILADDLDDAVNSLDVAADGRVVAAARDGSVRLYDAGLRRIARSQLPGGLRPFSASFSPDASQIAVGLTGGPQPEVMLLASDGLTHLKKLSGGDDRRGGLALVAWSADGGTLYGAGTYGDAAGVRYIRRWPVKGSAPASDISLGARDIVTDLHALAGGGVVFASADPAWGVVGDDGRARLRRERRQADFRDGFAICFAVSASGDVVDFGLGQGGRDCVRFDVTKNSLVAKPKPRADMSRPQVADTVGNVTGWRNMPRPLLNGAPVSLETNELARSAAVAAIGGGVAIGSDFAVRFFKGGGLAWKTSVSSPAWMVATTADGRYVVAGLGDGSIRWFNQTNGEVVASLFVVPNEDSWVLWTPEGLYDYGGGGEALIGYHRNRVADDRPAGADFVGVGQMYASYYRPDLVRRKLRGEVGAAVVDYIGRIGDTGKILDRGLPPLLRLVEYCTETGPSPRCHAPNPTVGSAPPATVSAPRVDAPTLTLRVELEDRGGGFGEVQALRDRVPVPITRATLGVAAQGRKRTDEYVVQLASGRNDISLSARNVTGEIQSSPEEQPQFSVVNEAAAAKTKPTLYVISIGVNKFGRQPVQEHQLRYAVADAEGIIEMMKTDKSRSTYSNVEAVVRTDESATLENIKDSFSRVAERANSDDVGLIFLAGHGVNLDGNFNYLPYDLHDLTPDGIRDSALTHEHLVRLLRSLPMTRVLVALDTTVLDTPFSDAFNEDTTETAAGRLGKAVGRVILSGATTEQEAMEGEKDHGVFASVLLEALAGKADEDRNGRVDVIEVSTYSLKRVPAEAARLGQAKRQPPVSKTNNASFTLLGLN